MFRSTIRARAGAPLVLCLAAVVLAVPSAGAATFTPTRFDDPPPDGCAPADCSLREAVIAANAAADPDTIKLQAGTYSLTVEGVGEEAAATGDLDVTEDLTVTGAGAELTTIDGAWPAGADRMFHVLPDPDTQLVISGVTIRDGGGAGDAAGILAGTGTTLTLSDSVVTSNQTTGEVGGIWADGATTTLVNVVVSDNRSDCCGGISNTTGTMTIRNSSLVGNRSVDDSGGIYSSGVLTISDSTISENRTTGAGASTEGGGVFIDDVGQATLTNVTISGNSSTSSGGGLESESLAMATLNNVTITGNVADADNDGNGDGGGIHLDTSTLTTGNTIVAGNTDRGGQAPDCVGTSASSGHNLVQNTSGCVGFTGPGDITGRDAKLGPLADNGGPTQTHALMADSPAIDAGNPSTPGSGGAACAATDQRGAPRNCDIGAYEVVRCSGVVVNRVGTGGDDTLTGTSGTDGFLSGDGNDSATGLGGDDAFCLGAGNDRFLGGDGNDKGTGGAGRDLLKGEGGEDLLKGEAGRDRLIGGSEKDKLLGGGGKDRLNCGAGKKEVGKGGPGKDRATKCEKGKP